VDMARTAAVLSVLALVVLGTAAVGEEPAVVLALVGTALCALGCAGVSRSTTAVAPAVSVPGRCTCGRGAAPSRQHHPDSAGRPRPRAPGAALATA
jgi:hypothetical protein